MRQSCGFQDAWYDFRIEPLRNDVRAEDGKTFSTKVFTKIMTDLCI
jgi:hypothetical protein